MIHIDATVSLSSTDGGAHYNLFDTLTITGSAFPTAAVLPFTGTSTNVVYNGYAPLQQDNTLELGDVSHYRQDSGPPELSGSYSFTSVTESFTPEPASLGLLSLSALLGLRRARRVVKE
jgi:hypothetical protein